MSNKTQNKAAFNDGKAFRDAYNAEVSSRINFEMQNGKTAGAKVIADLGAGDRFISVEKTVDFAARVLTDVNVGFINERERSGQRTYAKAVPMFARIVAALSLVTEPNGDDSADLRWFGKVLGGNAFSMLIGAFYLHKRHGVETLTRDDLIALQTTRAQESALRGKMKGAFRDKKGKDANEPYGIGTASSHASMFSIALKACGLAETTVDADDKVKTLKIDFNHAAFKGLHDLADMVLKGSLPFNLPHGTTAASIHAKAA